MEKDSSNEEALNCLRNEAEIMQLFDDKWIIKYWFLREYWSHILLGMELCRGGSLKDMIKQKKMQGETFTDQEAALIIQNILKAVYEIHR